MSKKIAFIKIKSFSHVNQNISRALAKHFPDLEVDTIDVANLIKSRKGILLVNMFFVIKEYGLDVLLGRKNVKLCFFRTPYIFKRIKALMSSHLSKDRYAFSFQTQSLFDASAEGLPHFVYTDHTHLANLHYPDFGKEDLYSNSWIKLEKLIYQNASMVFTTSNFALRSVVEDYSCNPDKVVCVYSGINVATNFEECKKKYNNKNILFVGVDWNRKGGPELVDAFKIVLKEHPDARLTIAGCSPELDVPNCDVVGLVSSEEIRKNYEKASVFCLPSKLEPSAVAIVEASVQGLPVVSTDVGGTPDRILNGKTGCLVKPGDVEHLARVLIDLIGNPKKCQAFGEKGHRFAMERFLWEKVSARIKQNIESVIQNKDTKSS